MGVFQHEKRGAGIERPLRVWRSFSDVDREDFQTPDAVFQIGVSPRRIDILTSIEGVEFEDAWPQRMDVEIDGLTVPVIGKKHLIENKRALDCSQDLADIERLQGNDS